MLSYLTAAFVAAFVGNVVIPPRELTTFESVGLPGYRTLRASPVWNILESIGVNNILGIPSDFRLEEVASDCQILLDNDATMVHLRSWGLPHAPRKALPFVCSRLLARATVVPGRVNPLARALSVIPAIINILPTASVLVLSALGLLCALFVGALWLYVRRYRFVNQVCDRPLMTHREVRASLLGCLEKVNGGKWFTNPSNNDHWRMAEVRRTLEKACVQVLLKMSNKIRDIGGSLSRNGYLGKSLHICFPNVTGLDKLRLAVNPQLSNDVGLHSGQDCPHSNRPSFMTYVDFHLTKEDLVKAVRSPTFIVTHDFSRVIGTESWFEGEATVERTGDFITMTTRGGSQYTHGFHSWGTEGVVATPDGAFTYQRVFDEHHSIILWCTPVAGRYDPLKDNTLASSAGKLKNYELSNGAVATLDGHEYVIHVPPQGDPMRVRVATLVRTAFQMCFAPRDEKWHANCASVLRSRFTTDDQPEAALPSAQELVVQMADQFAVSYNQSVVGDPRTYGLVARTVLRTFLRIKSTLPFTVERFVNRLLLNARSALAGRFVGASWAWHDVKVPTYEVHWHRVVTTQVEAQTKLKQPFRDAGAASIAAPPLQHSPAPGADAGKPDGRNRKESVRDSAQASSRPAPAPAGPPAPNPLPLRCQFSGLALGPKGYAPCRFWKNPPCKCGPVPRHPARVPRAPKDKEQGVAKGGGRNSQEKKSAGPKPALASRPEFRGPEGQLPLPNGRSTVKDSWAIPPVLPNKPDAASGAIPKAQGKPVAPTNGTDGLRGVGGAVPRPQASAVAASASGSGKGRPKQ